jgi:uncharacterized membrane-anchored protein
MRSERSRAGAVASGQNAADLPAGVSKVAAVTVAFWILKVIMTTAGDLSGDALSLSLKLGYGRALIVVVAVFAGLFAAQWRTRRFVPWLYWLLILSASAVGAEISDSLDRAMQWGDSAGTGVLFGALVIALGVWFVRRGTVRFAPIVTRSDEGFYWRTAVIARSVGSAFGDWVGDSLGWGLSGGIAVNLGITLLVLLLWRTSRISRGALYWIGFVVTRVPF